MKASFLNGTSIKKIIKKHIYLTYIVTENALKYDGYVLTLKVALDNIVAKRAVFEINSNGFKKNSSVFLQIVPCFCKVYHAKWPILDLKHDLDSILSIHPTKLQGRFLIFAS